MNLWLQQAIALTADIPADYFLDLSLGWVKNTQQEVDMLKCLVTKCKKSKVKHFTSKNSH